MNHSICNVFMLLLRLFTLHSEKFVAGLANSLKRRKRQENMKKSNQVNSASTCTNFILSVKRNDDEDYEQFMITRALFKC